VADGSKLLTVLADHNVRVWDARTGQSLALLQGHTAKVTSAEFDATGASIVTASQDGTARVWDVATGRERCRLQRTDRTRTGGSRGAVPQFLGTVTFSPDGRRILGTPAMQAGWAAGLWDAQTGMEVRTAPAAPLGFSWLARFLPGGRLLTIRPSGVWSAEFARFDVSLEFLDIAPDRMCASPDGHLVAAASTSARPLALLDTRAGKVVRTLSGHGYGITALAFSRDGKLLASASNDGTARVWDVATGAERLAVPHPGVSEVMFTPDGRHLLTAGRGARQWPLRPAAEAEARRPRALTAAEQTRFGLDP
jgi:WD40 repeat protein